MSTYAIKIRQQKRPGERWNLFADAAVSPSRPAALPETAASESDLLRVQIVPPADVVPGVRVYVGSVLVASTLPTDRVVLIDFDDGDGADVSLVCKGRMLADWVGLTELSVSLHERDEIGWARVLTLPLAVTAGKLNTEQFNQLFHDLERESAAVLLDVHGKTQVGIKSSGPPASSAPVAMLGRIGATVRELTDLLHQMARQPASRLRVQRSRELALAGQAISDASLAEACRDPDMLARRGEQVAFREHLTERSSPDYRIAEHQAIADFGESLKAQLAELRQRIDDEIDEREGRRRWRNAAREPNQPTWWEAEDYPRIVELRRCRESVARLRGAVDRWSRLPFLPPGRPLRQSPQLTPVFRDRAVYRRVFWVMATHFLAYRATLDTHDLMTRARSLPVLYEWWCAVRVVGILARALTPLRHDAQASPLFATRPGLTQDARRFTIEFASDQAIAFADEAGARVRFRYQPTYAAGAAVSVLGASSVRTPDMAIEVFPAGRATPEVPELIVVLDAKYSSTTQWEKMTEVATKYSKIGDVRTGRVLSRQVWALTPASPGHGGTGDELRGYCTVDNEAFWSEQFDASNPVNGAVQSRPVAPGAYDPMEALVVSLLRRAGVRAG